MYRRRGDRDGERPMLVAAASKTGRIASLLIYGCIRARAAFPRPGLDGRRLALLSGVDAVSTTERGWQVLPAAGRISRQPNRRRRLAGLRGGQCQLHLVGGEQTGDWDA